MWLLDNLSPQSKEIKKRLSKFGDSTQSKKYQLKVDKFLLAGALCANCLSKLDIKVDIYPNMVLLVK